MGNISYFNQLAGRGNNDRLLQFNVYKRVFNDISKKISIVSGDVVLDLGAGCGELTKFMADKCNHIVLADGAPNAIEYAKKKLKDYNNISYEIADITKLPLPFVNGQFNKIICYSVVHYVEGLENFYNLLADLLRIIKPRGSILIGDIPLSDKYARNLEERKKYPIKNYLLNQKYYLKKSIIDFLRKMKKADTSQVCGTSYTKEAIENILRRFNNIEFNFLEQDKKLPLADSREDLLITKYGH